MHLATAGFHVLIFEFNLGRTSHLVPGTSFLDGFGTAMMKLQNEGLRGRDSNSFPCPESITQFGKATMSLT